MQMLPDRVIVRGHGSALRACSSGTPCQVPDYLVSQDNASREMGAYVLEIHDRNVSQRGERLQVVLTEADFKTISSQLSVSLMEVFNGTAAGGQPTSRLILIKQNQLPDIAVYLNPTTDQVTYVDKQSGVSISLDGVYQYQSIRQEGADLYINKTEPGAQVWVTKEDALRQKLEAAGFVKQDIPKNKKLSPHQVTQLQEVVAEYRKNNAPQPIALVEYGSKAYEFELHPVVYEMESDGLMLLSQRRQTVIWRLKTVREDR